MKNISRKIQTFVLLIPVCLALSTVFAVDETLANGIVTAKYFWFYGALSVTSIITLVVYGWRRNTVKLFSVDIALVSIIGFVLVVNYFAFQHGAISTKWILLLQLLLLYICLRCILQDKSLRFYVLLFFIFTGLIEAITGLRQLYGFIPSNHSLFLTTGTFFNSGPYSGYLSVIAPLSLFYCIRDSVVFNRKFAIRYLPFYLRFSISLLTFVAIVLVLPAGMSRAAWIAVTVGCGFVIAFRFLQQSTIKIYLSRHRKIVVVFVSIALLLASVSAMGIYRLKKDSADGRVLIWKTSLNVIAKHPFGVGIGHFPNAFGQEQALYFALGRASTQEELVAGNPEYAFNEYLQICIEFGVGAAIGLFTCFILLIYTGIKRKAVAVTGGLLSLLVFASMSYPFNLLPFLVVLVLFMALILSEKEQPIDADRNTKGILLNWKIVLPVLSLSCVLVLFTSNKQRPTYEAFKEWNDLKMFSDGSAGAPSLNKDYERLYPYLSDQTQYLFEYAQNLSKCGEYKKSNKLLEQATRLSCDPMLYNIMGKNDQKLGNYVQAEQHFLMASHLVPNRVYPYFLLAKLYNEKNDRQQACRMANEVLTKQPKVQSTAIIEMRAEMRKLIENQQ